MIKINDSIVKLKGIGEKSKKNYERLGIYTIKDLINYFPKRYDINKGVVNIEDLVVGEESLLVVTIKSVSRSFRTRKGSITSILVGDETGQIKVLFFNQPYLSRSLKKGKKINLKGKCAYVKNQKVLSAPMILNDADFAIIKEKPLIPVYSLTKKISNKALTSTINQAVEETYDQIVEYLPEPLMKKYDFFMLKEAIKVIHFPSGYEELQKARYRMIFGEFFLFALLMQKMKKEEERVKSIVKIDNIDEAQNYLNKLPYELTGSQKNVIKELICDLTSGYVMNRLIQGDVGSGKTLLASVAMLLCVINGYQCVLMAPTEILAHQHYDSFIKLFKDYDVNIQLLTGSLKQSEKIFVKEEILSGKADIIIATHAVLTEDVVFDNLGLVVTDEQHRFGVKQRAVLSNKGNKPHTLVMSATPIPRTLALIIYSDMDISINDDMPKGRQVIDTFLVGTSYRNRIYNFLLQEISKGNQCYVVCPKALEDEEEDSGQSLLEDVISYSKKLEDKLPEHIKICPLNGKMKSYEKDEIMNKFANGDIDILVSTTVIEVGINVQSATVIVIENAERFGLSTLHQLRGRVGRGKEKSYCILISDNKDDKTKERLDIMTKTNDGFEIAKKDLSLRGHGDLLGLRQSGIMAFKFGNIYDDAKLLKIAYKEAKEVIENGLLELDEYRGLSSRLSELSKDANERFIL